MTSVDAMRAVVERSAMSQASISQAMGRAPSYVSVLLSKPSDLRGGTMASLANVCGCELVVVDRATGERVAVIEP